MAWVPLHRDPSRPPGPICYPLLRPQVGSFRLHLEASPMPRDLLKCHNPLVAV
ncbi:hypothetical protein BDB00DRAFT_863709, partial [Zychaea mexicana]|uniref:uncharacterized protein n=1 Tax=Zychaea mexicana TaxID=64656 RepID=UPI0022FE3466